jgi:hypothetical protein
VLERAPFLGQLVLHPHGRLGHDDARDDSFRFELAQPLREHPIADVGDRAAKLGEAHPSVQEQLDDRSCPAAADEFHCAVEFGAEVGFQAHGVHSIRMTYLTQSTYFYIVADV